MRKPGKSRADFVVGIFGVLVLSIPALSQPAGSISFGIQPASGTIAAGDKTTLSAEILPADLDPVVKQQLLQSVTWALDRSTALPGDSLTGATGASVQVSGVKAFRAIGVIASLYDPNFVVFLHDTARILVNPASDYHVVVERTAKTPIVNQADILPKTYADSTTARPLSVISLDLNQNTAYAYAVVRDKFGNIKRAATNGSWEEVTGPGAVGAAPTPGKLWEGVISRTGAGDDSIRAWEAFPALIPDTVMTTAQGGVLISLRVVDSLGNVVTFVNITTDQSMFLRVQGQWSDRPGVWSDFPADWSMSPDTLRSSITLPAPGIESATWTFSPINPGQADVTVSNASSTQQVTVPVTVIVAPPSRIEFALLDMNPVAGVPFRAAVRIYNTDGLVPGMWCYSGYSQSTGQVVYQDIMMRPGLLPSVQTGVESGTVNLRPSESFKVSECFAGGIDTVHFTLFYAPDSTDSLHQLFVRVGGLTSGISGTIEGATAPFHPAPGPVDRIVIGDAVNCTPLLPDTTLQAPSGALTAAACGYDAYGNTLGQVPGLWSANGTLHPPPVAPSQSLLYTTDNVIREEQGCIVVAAQANTNVRDTICVQILPKPAVVTAVTRDTNGNGYLDETELHFDKPVNLSGAIVTVGYSHFTDVVDFPVTGVQSASGNTSDSVFHVTLTEVPTPNSPQTAWAAPYLTVSITAPNAAIDTIKYVDGAGPVVWLVSETINDPDPHKKLNVVTVTFSEKVIKQNGGALTASDIPKLLFDVWKTQTGTVRDTLILDSITSLKSVSVDSSGRTVVEFLPANINFFDQWVNIRVIAGRPDSTYRGVVDNVQNQWNPPVLENRRVQVAVHLGPGVNGNQDSLSSTSTPAGGHCGCGSGVGLAFIPPIGFRLGRFFRGSRSGRNRS